MFEKDEAKVFLIGGTTRKMLKQSQPSRISDQIRQASSDDSQHVLAK
jgi:hypothetical protein